jgi:membrane protease YdiL (CAAX protease family)
VVDPLPEPAPTPATAILPIERVGAALEVALCSGFPTQLLIIAILSASGMKLRDAAGALSPPFIFTLSLLDSVAIVCLVLLLLRAHRESPRTVLLGRRPAILEAVLGILLVPVALMVILAILVLLLAVAPQLHNVERNPLEAMLQTRQNAIAFAVVAMIAGGVREEVQRGFVLHRFERFLGGGTAGIVIFSALFGLGHIEQGLDAMIATALLGAFWGVVFLARRSIVAPMVSHAGFNLAQLAKYWIIA